MSARKRRIEEPHVLQPVIDIRPEPLTLVEPEPLDDEQEIIEEETDLDAPLVAPSGTLMAHCGTNKIGRDDLALITIPPATRTHKPVAHIDIVHALIEALSFRHITVVRDEYAVSPDGMRMFGLLDLNMDFSGCRFSIGIRNSNDKSMRLAMTIGYRVFVCDNMSFRGDFSPVLAKHSKSFDLIDTLSVGVDRMQRNFEPLKDHVKRLRDNFIKNEEAKLIIYEAFIGKQQLGLPLHLMRDVARHYFTPEYEEFKDPNLFSLLNAFTSAFKALKPVNQFRATARLGGYIEQQLPPF